MHESNNNGHDKKILVIGLGQIGYSNAEYLRSLGGLRVDGFDISEKAVERAIKDGIIDKKAADFAGYDYYLICISTHQPNDMFTPYQDGIMEVAYRIATEGRQGALVGIDSTIPKGTSRKVLALLNHKMHVVHVPHRYYGPEKKEHGVNQTRVIGGCEPCCMAEGKKFYGQMLGIPLHEVSAIEVAEMTKIVENSYRFLEIAFAEELKMVSESAGIDFDELRKAVNTKWNIKILEAREGIGGHCLPKDTEMFLSVAKNALDSSIVSAAKMVDHKYRFYLSQKPIAPQVELGKAKTEL
ncbi:UDP-N-acetyl-D-mannosaminuronate dehydrogenase [Candidatus Nitrososphaera evergladensis SR1]|jgi:nucleotide sugar dehydrogenase|uniref:UDP-N-acetyl-D-mannosaminuronate dehydrogenase n=1 Tax=Candidatus Nitrososphaera evergladensis SR1 TaxID=1459636 RepID=A0A075MTK3_9ARCH|nr:potassium transporter TrkA [Candidatus Nitrososphaera evergladensis]AIF84443.1 UDP-N-acetyl-D-mannosaminuronate dehydrogenase [Candidatus Nitrososphaera evergladensis SR1]